MKHETQRTARTSHGLLLATLIAAIGCGGGSAETETPAETEEATTETSGGETSTEVAGTETAAVAFDDPTGVSALRYAGLALSGKASPHVRASPSGPHVALT